MGGALRVGLGRSGRFVGGLGMGRGDSGMELKISEWGRAGWAELGRVRAGHGRKGIYGGG